MLSRLGWSWSKQQQLWWLASAAGIVFGLAALYLQRVGWQPSLLSQLAYPAILLAALGGFYAALLCALGSVILLAVSGETLLWLHAGSLHLLFALIVGALFRAAAPELAFLTARAGPPEDTAKMLKSLASTAEVRDSHTQGHSKRVAANAVLMGESLGLNETQLDQLYWGALLHDIGKIAVAEHILKKEGPLSDAEFAEVKKHPAFGAYLLTSISGHFTDIAEVVHCHHERWDGLGYPRQLRGAAIPLLSRIVSIVDVFEALTSVRAYREPVTPEEALNQLLAASGRQFDPQLLDVFEAVYHGGELSCAYQASSARDVSAAPQLTN